MIEKSSFEEEGITNMHADIIYKHHQQALSENLGRMKYGLCCKVLINSQNFFVVL
jgi:hypothetical protein